jgi:hypothetical protein
MNGTQWLDAWGLTPARVRVVVHPETLEYSLADEETTTVEDSLVALATAPGTGETQMHAWGRAAREVKGMRAENPFDGDASSFDAARALLDMAVDEVMRRRGAFASLRPPRVEVVLRRAIAPTLRDALMAGRDGEVLDHTIDGHAVPRRPRRRTRRDLVLLVWRSVILGGSVIWAWDRHPNRPALVAIVTLGEIAVVAEYTRLRGASS